MPRFAANLTMMFAEHPFRERFGAAARAGFKAVEFLFPYDFRPGELARELNVHGLTPVLFNLPPGDFSAGERGLAALPGREQEFKQGVDRALTYAEALNCRRLHVMAGNSDPHDREQLRATYVRNLTYTLGRLEGTGITLLIEPINRHDMPGYFLDSFALARSVLNEIGHSQLKLQLDWYHAQIMQGDLTRLTEELLPEVGHIQVAGVPDRHEPDTGEINFPHLFGAVDRLDYPGWIGCEYRPAARTEDGLGWLQAFTT
ncbi:MAG TPA: 2-oxo-tetronate isomerase [Chthoniobacterales bacterium]